MRCVCGIASYHLACHVETAANFRAGLKPARGIMPRWRVPYRGSPIITVPVFIVSFE